MKVVEMASIAAGPAAAAMLAEWGASVIKIEPMEGDPGRDIFKNLGVTDLTYNPEFDLHNRGKRSIAIDLGKPQAHAIVEALVRDADVFLTKYARGETARARARLGVSAHSQPETDSCKRVGLRIERGGCAAARD